MPFLAEVPPLPTPNPLWALPFAFLLLAIASLPLIGPLRHWWEKHRSKFLVGLVLGSVILVHYGTRGYGFRSEPGGEASRPGWNTVATVAERAVLEDYVPFMVLLFSLYVIAGGLQLRGNLLALPSVNTLFLATGAGLASLIGTTGASMVLIRPLLQTNKERADVRHTVVFFIFLVSNIGGCLLPIGDPPLFLGYLQGVPFLWTTKLIAPWATCVAILLFIYYAWDRLLYRRESFASRKADVAGYSSLRLRGAINLVWLLGVVLSVALIVPGRLLPGTQIVVADFVREGAMLGLAGLSWLTTPKGLRLEVDFSFDAILEVACLFLGIFLTMQVPIEILQARGASLGLHSPTQFFWSSGLLSGVLDNAPTYLVFFETARSLPVAEGTKLVSLGGGTAISEALLTAISLGSVFMGANTYIGNGPNFMVKAIAEARGVKMPSFLGYMAYSVGVLIPVFVLVTLIFFR